MGRDRGAAEPARYALLGLLLDRPSHGYDLLRRFTPGSALGDIVRLSESHLYALLSRLERDGLIVGEQQEGGTRPTRRVYSSTESGREAVLAWIDEPVGHPRDMRIDFPLKLYIAHTLHPSHAARLIDAQRGVFASYMARLDEHDAVADTEEDRVWLGLMRAGRSGRAQAAIDWLDVVSKNLHGVG
jgi:PadR family transcriptional regulator AphA